MRRRTLRPIVRGFGWAAALTGCLVLPHTATAQIRPQQGYRSVPVGSGREQTPAQAPNPAADAAALQILQTRVQLSWLADPLTFAHPLNLSAGPQGFLVTGYVPDEVVRQRALQLAAQQCGRPVVDGLQAYPYPIVRHIGTASAEALRREALAVLRESFGARAVNWQVVGGFDGRVTISGPFASPEEQLQVACALRRATRCTCVRSQPMGAAPPSAVAQVSFAPAPVQAPGTAYETTGELDWEPDPVAARIQEAIRARCGRDLRDVRVEFLKDGRLHITLRVAPGADRNRVENAVRQIPEVIGYGRNRGCILD
jgi:hypothetical protein